MIGKAKAKDLSWLADHVRCQYSNRFSMLVFFLMYWYIVLGLKINSDWWIQCSGCNLHKKYTKIIINDAQKECVLKTKRTKTSRCLTSSAAQMGPWIMYSREVFELIQQLWIRKAWVSQMFNNDPLKRIILCNNYFDSCGFR